MSKTVAYCLLICLSTVLGILSICHPEILSNKNCFIKGFMPHEFLAVIGVTLSITLTSAAQIHLKLNEIEEKKNFVFFPKTRSGVKSSAHAFIILFLLSVVLVIVRPYVDGIEWAESIMNSLGILFLFWTTLIMLSLTQLIFAIKPDIKN